MKIGERVCVREREKGRERERERKKIQELFNDNVLRSSRRLRFL